MFSFIKKIAIVLSLLAFSSGHLYASPDNNNNNDVVVKSVAAVPHPELYKMDGLVYSKLLSFLSEKINPATLRLVCKQWRDLLDADKNSTEQHIFNQQGPLMQICMNNWWAERFKNGVLRYTDPNTKEVTNLLFSGLGNVFKGTFDLSACGDRSQYVVITTDVERFFQVRGANEGKVVILVAPRELVKQQLDATVQPLAAIMAGWDAAKAPVGIFWRWGNDADPSLGDYLTVSSLSQVSSQDLYENWRKSVSGSSDVVRWVWSSWRFSCLFCEPK